MTGTTAWVKDETGPVVIGDDRAEPLAAVVVEMDMEEAELVIPAAPTAAEEELELELEAVLVGAGELLPAAEEEALVAVVVGAAAALLQLKKLGE